MLSDNDMGPSLAAARVGSSRARAGRGFARRNPFNSFNLTSIPAKLPHANWAGAGICRGHAGWPLRPERAPERTRMTSLAAARLTLVHDWLTGYRGGEKCLDVLCHHFPDAKLFTLLHARGSLPPSIERMDIRTSFLQRIPGLISITATPCLSCRSPRTGRSPGAIWWSA